MTRRDVFTHPRSRMLTQVAVNLAVSIAVCQVTDAALTELVDEGREKACAGPASRNASLIPCAVMKPLLYAVTACPRPIRPARRRGPAREGGS